MMVQVSTMRMMKDKVQGEIVSQAFGGQGILRYEGLVIFVPFTAVGDRVTCQIIQSKKTFAKAKLLSIDEPSQVRITPRCPYFGVCGGCQLQHLTYQTQLDHKLQCVKDAFQRIGHFNLHEMIPITIEPATQQWAYRRYIELTLQPKGDTFICGYVGVDQYSIISVEQCPIFCSEADPILKEVQEFISQLSSSGVGEGRIAIFKQKDSNNSLGYHIIFHFKYPPNGIEALAHKSLSRWNHWLSLTVSTTKKTFSINNLNKNSKACLPTLNINGLQIHYSLNAFLQNHPEQSLKIYLEICRYATLYNCNRVLDLYCGIGILSLMLIKEGILRVIGIENNNEAVKTAKHNAMSNGISSEQALFIASDAEIYSSIENLNNKDLLLLNPELVIVNPPRTGLNEKVILGLKKNLPQHIIYVSCMPTTLARDLSLLLGLYEITLCRSYDMFPQTAHVEVLVALKRKV